MSPLRRWLHANYDFTIVDCPPSIALQVKVFLMVADAFIVPSIPDRLSVRGSLYLHERIQAVIKEVQAAGFVFEDYATLHYRPDDTLQYDSQRESIKGFSDRYTLRFRKPLK